MRPIGSIANEQHARWFGDYLYVRGIDNDIEPEEGAWTIWIHDDHQIEAGGAELAAFLREPDAPRYRTEAAQAAARRHAAQEDEAKARVRHVDVRTQLFTGASHTPYVTYFLLGICAVISVLILTAEPERQAEVMRPLRISAYDVHSARDIGFAETLKARMELGLPEILGREISKADGGQTRLAGGQVWRLITPIFIHFSLAHILFNFLALRQLGALMECHTGAGFMIAFVGVTALLSNLGQYMVSGPAFGGMSGVNYALFGYLWIRGRNDPGFGVELDQGTVWMMLVWFVLCFTGLLGNIANTAHGLGLAAGAGWGWLQALRAR